MNIANSAAVVKLDDKNYETWKIQARSVLVYNDLWPYASGTEVCPGPTEEEKRKNWLAKDSKALALILLSVQDSQLSHVRKATTSHEAWKVLEEVHSSKGPARKIMLYKRLFQMKKGSDQSMADHIREFQNNVDRLDEVNVVVPAELLSIMLLNTLPDEYEGFCIAIESRDDLPSLDKLKIKLIEEENRRKHASDGNEGINTQNALLSNDKNRFKWNNKRKEPHTQRKTHTNTGPKPTRFEGTCYNCGKRGHKAAECRSKKNGNKSDEAAMTAALSTDAEGKSDWYLDSGATAHMCNDQNLFVNWKSKVHSTIQTAGNDVIDTCGIGTVCLNVSNRNRKSSKITLNNVIYSPGLRHNLISVSKATECGFKVIFAKDCALVKRTDGSCILKAENKEKLYVVKIQKNISLYAKDSSTCELLKWHQRLGHLNFSDVIKLQRKNLVNGLEKENFKALKVQCTVCDKAKINQLPFRNSTHRENDILDVVHSDICGPLSEKSLGGARYFVTFIDGKSRYTEVAFLKNRSDVFKAFEDYQKRVELETGKRIKCLRTDNAREYTSEAFNNYLKKQGIKRQFSVEYTPQQNGIAERANRTLMEMTRSMLIEANLPKSLWAEALNTAAYIRNRCPSNAVENKTPFEVWSGKKPNIKYFRSFGCKVIALEKGPNRSKLDAKGQEYTFVGYSHEAKAYRLWDGRKTIVKRRDVRFYEKLNINNFQFFEAQIPDAKPTEDYKEMNKEADADDSCPSIELKIESSENEGEEIHEPEQNEENITETQSEAVDPTGDACARQSILSEPPFEGFAEDEISNDEDYLSCAVQETSQAKRKGRPIILRTGKRGRPRKVHQHQVNLIKSETMNYPSSFEEAMNSENRERWITAMKSELESLERNKTWDIVERPKDKTVLTNKWVYNIKYNSDGSVNKYKARLVARGCEQRSGIDYNEVYAPVVRYETLRTLFALCAEHQLHLHHMDFITAYVQGELEEEIFMEQPLHPTKDINKEKVCKLFKPLYGLKQAGRQWHKKLDDHLQTLGLKQTSTDKCLYVKHIDGKVLAILVYVDDLIIASNCLNLLNETKQKLSSQFLMKDLGEVSKILGIEVKRESSTGKIEINQKQYIEKLLERFKMKDANPVSTPLDTSQKLMEINEPISEEEAREMEKKPYRELIGGLTYLSTTTRPDISFAVNFLARFCSTPRIMHWNAAKRLLRYLKGTMEYSIKFQRTGKNLGCYVDADWAGDMTDRRSCSGFVIILAGGAIRWKTQKQRSVALSTMEAEYIALSEITKEVIYLRRLLIELGFQIYCEKGTTIYCDNQSAVKFSQDSVAHERSKHVDIRYHFCRDMQNKGEVIIEHLPSERMVSDLLTKGLTRVKHEVCINMLNLC